MQNQLSISKIEYCPLVPAERQMVATMTVFAMVAGVVGALVVAVLVAWIGTTVGGNSGGKIIALALLLAVLGTIYAVQRTSAMGKALVKKTQLLTITSGGVIFPVGSLIQLRGRRWRRWEELSRVDLHWHQGQPFTVSDAVVLVFKDGCKTTFTLAETSNQAIEQFIVSLEMWAPHAELSADFAELRAHISPALKAQGLTSYTAIWNDELSRRFSLATFKVLPPGTKLQDGRYEISTQLSFGGFSAVYNGVNNHGKQVVIKEMSLANIDTSETRAALVEHLEREASILSKLSHSRICHLLDTFVEKDRQYLVLEKIPGRTIRQIVAESGPMSQRTVCALASQMVEVLEYLHEQSPPLVHRDFTPDNLIVRDNNYLVLIDFNAATEFMSGATGTIIGRHHYMPPEQIKGKSKPASDYYSMACTLAFMLTGNDPRPLARLNLKESGVQIALELDALLSSMTEMDWTQRPDLAHISATLQALPR